MGYNFERGQHGSKVVQRQHAQPANVYMGLNAVERSSIPLTDGYQVLLNLISRKRPECPFVGF